MTTAKELATEMAMLRQIEIAAYARRKQLLAEFMAAVEPGDRVACSVNGQRVAQVTVAHGPVRASVVNERAFTDWVRTNHPSEIVQSVRPAYQKILEDAAKAAGMGVDPTTGEEVPGIVVEVGEPQAKVLLDKAAPVVLADAAGVVPDALALIQWLATPGAGDA